MPARKILSTPQMATELHELTARGGKRGEMAGMLGVSRSTLERWLAFGSGEDGMRAAYEEGKKAYAYGLAEELVEDASGPLHDDPKLANAEVQRRRLMVDTKKWIAARLLPKVYGENLQINHDHSGEVLVSPLAQLRQLEGGAIGASTATLEVEIVAPSEEDCF